MKYNFHYEKSIYNERNFSWTSENTFFGFSNKEFCKKLCNHITFAFLQRITCYNISALHQYYIIIIQSYLYIVMQFGAQKWCAYIDMWLYRGYNFIEKKSIKIAFPAVGCAILLKKSIKLRSRSSEAQSYWFFQWNCVFRSQRRIFIDFFQ